WDSAQLAPSQQLDDVRGGRQRDVLSKDRQQVAVLVDTPTSFPTYENKGMRLDLDGTTRSSAIK
ncbi:MAG: hypothetical protein SVR94_08550, partial [Pseudomonadota bacterium]|nr:hypothetical protein [Pseudomonadota bacterium]